jgi:hypothetical protein
MTPERPETTLEDFGPLFARAAERGQIAERAAVRLLEALFQFTQTKIAREVGAKYNLNWVEAFPVKELLATTLPRVRSFVRKRFVKFFPTCA